MLEKCKNKTKPKINKDRKEQQGCAFKLDFLQLIFKASLIFKLNLKLALSIILIQR